METLSIQSRDKNDVQNVRRESWHKLWNGDVGDDGSRRQLRRDRNRPAWRSQAALLFPNVCDGYAINAILHYFQSEVFTGFKSDEFSRKDFLFLFAMIVLFPFEMQP